MSVEKVQAIDTRYEVTGQVIILADEFRTLARAPLELAAMRRAPAVTWVGNASLRVTATEDAPVPLLMLGFPNINHPGQFVRGELLTAITLANALKATMNNHAADATEHPGGADVVNFPVATADADDLASLLTLAGDLLTAYEGHETDAANATPTYHEATEAADHSLTTATAPTTLQDAIDRLNELKDRYNDHDADATAHTTGGTYQETASNTPLTDNFYRVATANVTCNFGVATDLWGTEKASQWYALFATAANADLDYALKAMPLMRYKSQASQVISLGTLLAPATGIGYGFTTDELVGGIIYILSGDSAGLMRTITANNNDNTTGGTITYSGTALTMAEGDWFIVLPPGINFRWLLNFYNNVSSNFKTFLQDGNHILWDANTSITAADDAYVENVAAIDPMATWFQFYVQTNASAPGDPSFASKNDTAASYGRYWYNVSSIYHHLLPTRFSESFYHNLSATYVDAAECLGYVLPDGYFG